MRIGHPGESETVAYDLTSVLFFGISCPLTELGYNTKHAQQLQVNLALLVSKNDKCPISHFIYNGRTGHIYAKRTTGKLFGEKRSVVVYTNQERRTSKINDQNEVLAYIGEELNALSEKRKDWSEARLHKAIDGIVGSGKDFVEKVFRTLKTTEEMEPVRHRLEQRVRVYIFVCVLAYRLLAYLQWRLENLSDHKDVWKEADAFLHDLERVERVEIRLGHQVRIWHLNLTGISEKTLEMIGFKDLLKETTAVDFKL